MKLSKHNLAWDKQNVGCSNAILTFTCLVCMCILYFLPRYTDRLIDFLKEFILDVPVCCCNTVMSKRMVMMWINSLCTVLKLLNKIKKLLNYKNRKWKSTKARCKHQNTTVAIYLVPGKEWILFAVRPCFGKAVMFLENGNLKHQIYGSYLESCAQSNNDTVGIHTSALGYMMWHYGTVKTVLYFFSQFNRQPYMI